MNNCHFQVKEIHFFRFRTYFRVVQRTKRKPLPTKSLAEFPIWAEHPPPIPPFPIWSITHYRVGVVK